jgi:tetratricopeptide (TPR) repeat protein
MRRTILDTKENLQEFVQQPESCLLLVGAGDGDVAYVLKIQEQLQGEDPASIYFSFADDFLDEATYAQAIAQRLVDLLRAGNEERVAEGRERLAPFPAAMVAPATPARRRLILAFEHMKQWLPSEDEQRIVMALMPLRLSGGSYFNFVSQFAELAEREPWMRYGRVIGRDDRATHVASRVLGEKKARGVLAFDVDFSIDAMAADMSAEAVDPSVPLGDRMQAYLQLAMIDMSYKRHEEATRKYSILYEYYARADAPIMQAMCLLGAGDCLRMAGDFASAKDRYQQGLAIVMQARSPHPIAAPPLADGSPNPNPAMHPSAPPVLLNLLLAAAETSMALQQFEDARDGFDSASRVAAKCMNPFAAADALERQGDAEVALGQHAAALTAWTDAEKIARAYHHHDRLESVLERIHKLYQEARIEPEAAKAERALLEARRQREHAPA